MANPLLQERRSFFPRRARERLLIAVATALTAVVVSPEVLRFVDACATLLVAIAKRV